MNADDVESARTDILELVRRTRTDNDDVARAGVDFLPIGGEPRMTGADNPGFRIGVAVQAGARAGNVVDEKEGNLPAVRLALEGHGSAWTRRQLVRLYDLVHAS